MRDIFYRLSFIVFYPNGKDFFLPLMQFDAANVRFVLHVRQPIHRMFLKMFFIIIAFRNNAYSTINARKLNQPTAWKLSIVRYVL